MGGGEAGYGGREEVWLDAAGAGGGGGGGGEEWGGTDTSWENLTHTTLADPCKIYIYFLKQTRMLSHKPMGH